MQAVARPPCAGAAAARLAVASYPRRLRGLAAPLRAGDCGAGGRARSPLALTQAIFGRGGGAARSPASARLGGLGGAGLLEKPSFTFEREARVEIRLSPQYKVLLHNDEVNRRDYVVKVLIKSIEGMTVERAEEVMVEADAFGLALVIVVTQEKAEEYCEKLRGNGLISTIEPDS